MIMKQKKISIDEKTHALLVSFCEERDLKMGAFVARIIREKLNNDSRRETDTIKK